MALGGTAPCPLCWDTALLAALGVLRGCPPRLVSVALPAVLCVWEAQLCCPRTGHSSRSSVPRQGRRSSALCLDVPDAGSSAFGVTALQPRGFERIAQCPPVCPPLLPCEGSLTSLVTCLRQTERPSPGLLHLETLLHCPRHLDATAQCHLHFKSSSRCPLRWNDQLERGGDPPCG